MHLAPESCDDAPRTAVNDRGGDLIADADSGQQELATDMRRVSVTSMDGREILRSFALPATSTVNQLQEHVAKASGVDRLAQRLVSEKGRLLRPESSLQQMFVSDGALLTLIVSYTTVEYRVMQGPIFKKIGEEPRAALVVGSKRKVGFKIRTTGQLWTGPAGGAWVQVDTAHEKPGWLLIEGPGFGHSGPLLEKVEDREEEPIILRLKSPINPEEFFHICVRPSATIADAKYWMMCQFPGIKRASLAIVTDDPKNKRLRNVPAAWVKKENTQISELGLKDGDELLYLYIGDASFDIDRHTD